MTKWIAKTSTGCFFIGDNYELKGFAEDAKRFNTVGACMKACIHMNEKFGKAVFAVCQIEESEQNHSVNTSSEDYGNLADYYSNPSKYELPL